MIYADHIRDACARLGRALCVPALFACALLPGVAQARQAETPAAAAPPQAPAAQAPVVAPAARQVPARAPRAAQGGEPRAPRAAPAAATPAASRPPAQVVAPRAPESPVAPLPPREVVTVVHRLSGWKLLAWLAASGSPLELDELPSAADVHTNIVAGYVYQDGRSVMARLPQSEVELEAFALPPTPPAFFGPAGAARAPEPEYMLVTAEGKRVGAKFVGLDASTGLTLLEANERLVSSAPMGTQGDTDDPAVGQRVRLFAPAPTPRAAATQQAQAGFIYLSIDQKEGRLTEVTRASSGRPSRVVASADVSQAWTGAVAANELGDVVGIVSQSLGGETQILPIATVRDACERVLKLRGGAPQPWLGARADAASQASLDAWARLGWPAELARPHIEKGQGVFLTSVAPGTPAAQAGLKPGDLIAGVGALALRGPEDLSWTLKEAGVGSTVDMTVWRALEPAPFKVSVELKGAMNPALATAEAEEREARAATATTQREVVELRAAHARLSGARAEDDTGELARLRTRLAESEARLAAFRRKLEEARAKVGMARAFNFEPQAFRNGEPLAFYAGTARLRFYGLNAIGLSPRGASRLGAKGGVLVVAVRPESPAAASGLLSGDVIEMVNGAPLVRGELRRLLSAPESSPLALGLVREGRRLTVSFTPSFGAEQQR